MSGPTSFERFPPEALLGPLNEVERHNAPPWLYATGHLDVLRAGPRVSIVGSREASPLGLQGAAWLARELVAHGVVIVSGLAKGIDTTGSRRRERPVGEFR